MECLGQVNSNLVSSDRVSTAALDIRGRCPACDNFRSRGSPMNTDNNSNCPTSQNLSNIQSTHSADCSCKSPPLSPNSRNRESNIDSLSPIRQESKSSPPQSSSLRLMSSSPLSQSSPPSSSPLTNTTKSLDDQLTCLSCNQPRTQALNTHSCHHQSSHQSSRVDTLHSFEGLSPPHITTSTFHSSQYPRDRHELSERETDRASVMSPFRRDSDPEDALLLSQSPHHHHSQSQPIAIQHKSSTSRSPRHRHHNDSDLTEGCSLTPSAHADHFSTSRLNTELPGSVYNPFASSPADRLSLHFYSQQSPKYFRMPSSPSSPLQYGVHSPGHTSSNPKESAVLDQKSMGSSSKTADEGGHDNASRRGTSLPLKNRNSSSRQEADRHRHPHSSWKSRLLPKDDGSSGEDDVAMTPIDRPKIKLSDSVSAEAKSREITLPRELLFQLHDLEHYNEDLSAEVILAIEERGLRIHQVLGKGISSTVRRVTEKTTGQEYAVKIIDISGEKGDSELVEQTKRDTAREIKILHMCGDHDNIIRLHDVFETPTFIFLVFELCRQGELFDYLTSVVSLSEKRTRIIMRQLFDAVQFIHENRIVHRDLKPENILLDDDLNIKVSDFGFATIVEEGEELGELCGTPGYLAPEVLAHSMYENVSGYGKEVDMWSCGVIMYTLLCGAPPFWNRRQMMMLRAIMNADYTFNSPEWDDISEAPKNLIQKLLVVDPKERLTAREALAHPFFQSKVQELTKFRARRKFRAGVFCVLFYKRLARFYKHPPPISMETLCTNPYSIKFVRKAIDTCAFSMYRHWVKRVDNQNRAALFEHTLRDEWKHNTVMAANNTDKVTPLRH